MRAMILRVVALSLLAALSSGCGGGGSASNPPPSCTPASPPTAAYVSNNNDSTVSMYTVNSCTGALAPTAPPTVSTGSGGPTPTGVAVTPSGKFAYVANQVDGSVAMFIINSSTGILTPTSPPTIATGAFPMG